MNITKASKKDDILRAYQALKDEADKGLIPWDAQVENLKGRWAIHSKEFDLAVKETFNLGKSTRKMLDEALATF